MLNRYLRVAESQGDPIQTNDLYIVGLATVFIASKFEDKIPITLEELYRDAGHKNFGKELICEAEKEILQLLSFKICGEQSVYYEAMLLLKNCLLSGKLRNCSNNKVAEYSRELKEVVERHTIFLCMLTTLSHNLETLPP